VTGAVCALLETVGAPPPLVGYSQGGRLALLVALERPDLVSALVTISASPGIAGPAERRARRTADDALARHIIDVGASAFLDEWLAADLTGTTDLPAAVRREDRRMREANTAAGLAAALRGYGQGSQPWVGDRLAELAAPAVFVAGGDDERYAGLAREMAAAAPRGRAEIVEGAGHNLVLRQPGRIARIIDRALSPGRR